MIIKSNDDLIQLVKILSDGSCHGEDSLAKSLKISRYAVMKLIKTLQMYAVPLDFIDDNGWLLRDELTLLEVENIKANLANPMIDIDVFECIDSTNTYLQNDKNSQTTKICLAEIQMQGKGRLNRDWYSPFGKNIYLSCLYPIQRQMNELAGLSLVVALAIRATLNEEGLDDGLVVKWPNDVLYNQQKISGTLIDVQGTVDGSCRLIIGVGINVNMLDDVAQISQAWTSIRKILNRYVDRNVLAARLIDHLIVYLGRFAKNGFADFKEEWMCSDHLMNQSITLKNMDVEVTGKMIGVDDDGRLLLAMDNGQVRIFSSGDTSIVKK